MPHAGICAGGRSKERSLPRSRDGCYVARLTWPCACRRRCRRCRRESHNGRHGQRNSQDDNESFEVALNMHYLLPYADTKSSRDAEQSDCSLGGSRQVSIQLVTN